MPTVTRSDKQAIVTLTITRPPINALDQETLDELSQALSGLESDTTVRVVVLASGVGGVFCTGGDLRFWRQFPRDKAREVSRAGRQVFARLQRLPFPTIAAIEGHVIGDGLALEQVVGRPRALELLLTGVTVDAERALSLGLVSRVVPPGQSLIAAEDLAVSISRKSPLALAWSKRALSEAPGVPDRGAWEEHCFAQVWGGEDWQAGIEALLEKSSC